MRNQQIPQDLISIQETVQESFNLILHNFALQRRNQQSIATHTHTSLQFKDTMNQSACKPTKKTEEKNGGQSLSKSPFILRVCDIV